MTELIHWRAKQYYKYKSVLDISELRSCEKVGVAFLDLPPNPPPQPPPPPVPIILMVCVDIKQHRRRRENRSCVESRVAILPLPYKSKENDPATDRVQELCESRGSRPGLSVLMSFTETVDVKQH